MEGEIEQIAGQERLETQIRVTGAAIGALLAALGAAVAAELLVDSETQPSRSL